MCSSFQAVAQSKIIDCQTCMQPPWCHSGFCSHYEDQHGGSGCNKEMKHRHLLSVQLTTGKPFLYNWMKSSTEGTNTSHNWHKWLESKFIPCRVFRSTFLCTSLGKHVSLVSLRFMRTDFAAFPAGLSLPCFLHLSGPFVNPPVCNC